MIRLNVESEHAEGSQVFQTKDVTATHLDAALASLPPTFAIGELGQARLIIGPTGCTVLLAESSEPVPETASNDLAQSTRMNLADHLSWVPFVDALVVTHQNDVGSIVSVELDLLIPLLVDGPTMLDQDTITRLVALLNERRLKPEWVAVPR